MYLQVASWVAIEQRMAPKPAPSLREESTSHEIRLHGVGGGEYCGSPMEFTKQILEEKLMNRPTVLQLMRRNILRHDENKFSIRDFNTSQNLFGYDLMESNLAMGRRDDLEDSGWGNPL